MLFKGRLRLLKDGNNLIVFVNRHDIAGKMPRQTLLEYIYK